MLKKTINRPLFIDVSSSNGGIGYNRCINEQQLLNNQYSETDETFSALTQSGMESVGRFKYDRWCVWDNVPLDECQSRFGRWRTVYSFGFGEMSESITFVDFGGNQIFGYVCILQVEIKFTNIYGFRFRRVGMGYESKEET